MNAKYSQIQSLCPLLPIISFPALLLLLSPDPKDEELACPLFGLKTAQHPPLVPLVLVLLEASIKIEKSFFKT